MMENMFWTQKRKECTFVLTIIKPFDHFLYIEQQLFFIKLKV